MLDSCVWLERVSLHGLAQCTDVRRLGPHVVVGIEDNVGFVAVCDFRFLFRVRDARGDLLSSQGQPSDRAHYRR